MKVFFLLFLAVTPATILFNESKWTNLIAEQQAGGGREGAERRRFEYEERENGGRSGIWGRERAGLLMRRSKYK